MKNYEIIPHTADIKIRAYGTTLSDLFSNTLIGMFDLCEPKKIIPEQRRERTFCLSSINMPYLLVDFLSDSLTFSDIYNEVYDHVLFQEFSESSLKAVVSGYAIHGFGRSEIKAVTYHELELIKYNEIWQSTVVLDI